MLNFDTEYMQNLANSFKSCKNWKEIERLSIYVSLKTN